MAEAGNAAFATACGREARKASTMDKVLATEIYRAMYAKMLEEQTPPRYGKFGGHPLEGDPAPEQIHVSEGMKDAAIMAANTRGWAVSHRTDLREWKRDIAKIYLAMESKRREEGQ